MAPSFVQAGTGTAVLTGSGTVSLNGATAGNIVFLHVAARGTTDDGGITAPFVNIEALDGTDNSTTGVISGSGPGSDIIQQIQIGRVIAGGAVSFDLIVGASGDDLYGRIYELSQGSTGAAIQTVLEDGASDPPRNAEAGVSTTIQDAGITTNAADRLALNFVALASDQDIGNFTGETGGDWVEAAEFRSASGSACTLQLQTSAMPAATTIDGGTATITSSAWVTMGTALIPAPAGSLGDNPPFGFSGRGAGW